MCKGSRPKKNSTGGGLKQGISWGTWRGPVGESRGQQSELSCRVSCSKTLTLAPPAVTASSRPTPQHL